MRCPVPYRINLPSTWHGFPAKAFQVSLPAVHLARNSRESVPGVFPRRPPGTVSLQKRSRCHFLPPTWHGIPAKAFQVASPCRPPGTVSPQKRSRCLSPPSTWHGIPAKAWQVAPLIAHLARNSCKSVPGASSPPSTWHGIPAKVFQVPLLRRPHGTVFQRKRSRCLFSAFHLPRFSSESVPGASSPPSTCHGFPAKAFQVASPCRPPGTVSPQKRSRCPFLPPTWHGIPAKAFQVSLPASHLPRNPRESVPGSFSRRPPGTEFPRKCSRCPFLPPTCHGIPAKAWQVAPLIAHLPRQFLSSWDVGAFQQDKLVVCSMERVAVCTPAVGECVHLSEYHDVLRMA